MDENERKKLLDELDKIEIEVINSDFFDPAKMRRREEIRSLLLSDGKTDQLHMMSSGLKKSHRVTSFTKDRR